MIKSKNQFKYLVINIDSDLNFNGYTENPKKKNTRHVLSAAQGFTIITN